MNTTKDDFEKEILRDLERGNLKHAKNAKQEIKMAQAAAAAYLRKDARINIRLAGSDLTLIKRKAAQEGMPYQTLIASILHKYAAGNLR